MNVNAVGRVTFRFTATELGSLFSLLNVPQLSGISVRAGKPDKETIQRLAEDGVIIPCGECVFVDNTIARVLRSAAESRRVLTAESEPNRIALYSARKMCVLIEERQGVLNVEPLQNLAAARAPFYDAILCLGGAPRLLMRDEEGRTTAWEGTESVEKAYQNYARLGGV